MRARRAAEPLEMLVEVTPPPPLRSTSSSQPLTERAGAPRPPQTRFVFWLAATYVMFDGDASHSTQEL